MPVPGAIIFGPAKDGKQMTFERVRAMTEREQIGELKRRLDTFLVAQIQELAPDKNGDKKVYSPFPLAIMTCIATESIGQMFFGSSVDVHRDEQSRACFREVLKRVDRKLFRPMQRGFFKKMRQRWVGEDLSALNSAADVIYKFFRNTMAHGYSGRGVYLTEDETESWDYKDGYFVLHPYWFWDAFTTAYDSLFSEAISDTNSGVHRSCARYLHKLLN